MQEQVLIKPLAIKPTERVKCFYCRRRIRTTAHMVRAIDEHGRVDLLALFCSFGCAFANALAKQPEAA